MKYSEELHWILDKIGAKLGDEAAYQENIAFVHSLGLKCDCVGWSRLDLTSPRVEELLAAIRRFCRENGWRARGMYTREYAGESEWYELCDVKARDGFFSGFREVPGEDGGTVRLCEVKAYQELSPAPKQRLLEHLLVPERFRAACLEEGMTGIDFCWAQDKGKYDAPQYFHVYPRHAVQHMTESTYFHWYAEGMPKYDPRQTARLMALGGSLPKLTEVFSDLMLSLPRCYLAAELPAGGFSGAFMPASNAFATGRLHVLIHGDTAAVLLKGKALQSSWLKPAPVLDAFLPGYEAVELTRLEAPSASVRDELLAGYEKLTATERPVRLVTEKEALKLLRSAKKERKEDFRKALPKTKASVLTGTPYEPLLPLYQLTDGGYLSDEYELLAHARAVEENEVFHREMAAEELLDEKPDGVVLALCPDGDRVLLCADGTVQRFSHEEPVAVNRWPSLPMFVVDAVNDSE